MTKTITACVKCGVSERYSNGACKACARAKNALRRSANPKRENARSNAWKAANPEMAKASYAAWVAVNHEKKKAKDAKWRAANPEANRINCQNRRARKREGGGTLSKDLATKLFNLQKGMCPCCKQPLGNDYHLDHKMPLALGGPNSDGNMQLLRGICNKKKGTLHPVDFMRSKGFLL
jgi:hypothetical protein